VGSILFFGVNGGTAPFRYSIDGGQTFSDAPLFEDLPPGFYDLEVKDAEGCRLYGTAQINEPPSIAISLPPDVTVNLGETWEPQPGLNIPFSSIEQVNWSPAGVQIDCDTCLRPVIRPLEDGLYTLAVLDDKGCTATASTFVTVLQRVDVYVPNVFSPNGDGINDVLILFARPGQIAIVKRFNIYSRWGETVFEGRDFQPNDPSAGWDGTHRGKLMNPAVYAWWAEVELLNGVREILKGDVTLIR
jgi:gliding motility-associated-like protein